MKHSPTVSKHVTPSSKPIISDSACGCPVRIAGMPQLAGTETEKPKATGHFHLVPSHLSLGPSHSFRPHHACPAQSGRNSHSSHVCPRGASVRIMSPGGGVGKGKRRLLVVRCWLFVGQGSGEGLRGLRGSIIGVNLRSSAVPFSP